MWEGCTEASYSFISKLISSREVTSKSGREGLMLYSREKSSVQMGEDARLLLRFKCMGLGACTKCLVEQGLLPPGNFLRNV